jgi:hypothetical protein
MFVIFNEMRRESWLNRMHWLFLNQRVSTQQVGKNHYLLLRGWRPER